MHYCANISNLILKYINPRILNCTICIFFYFIVHLIILKRTNLKHKKVQLINEYNQTNESIIKYLMN